MRRGSRRSRVLSLHQRVSNVMHEFAGMTTCHGLSRIIDSESAIGRIIWSIITCAALGAFVFGGCKLLIQYSEHPHTTKLHVISADILPFPQVTVCNMNIMRRSQLLGTRFEELIAIDDNDATGFNTNRYLHNDTEDAFSSSSIAFDSIIPSGSSEMWRKRREWREDYDSVYDWYFENNTMFDKNWTNFIDVLEEDRMESWSEVINPTNEEVRVLGHQVEDFVLQCIYNNRPCSQRDFVRTFESGLGNCFTFNFANKESSDIRHTRKTGAKSGLHLTLFIEQPEYIGFLSPEVGVKVAISPPYQRSYPDIDGIALAPGFSTFIGLKQTSLDRLGEPYGDCKKRAFNQKGDNYTIKGCLNECLDNLTYERCECHTESIYGLPRCNTQHRKDRACLSLCRSIVFDLLSSRCNCTKPCREVTYRKTVSFVEWPSERFQSHLSAMLKKNSEGIPKVLRNVSTAKQNLVRLKVFFQELSSENIEQIPLYSLETLLSEIGGLMGLCIGLSVITLFEFMALFKRVVDTMLQAKPEEIYIKPTAPVSKPSDDKITMKQPQIR